MGNVDIEAREEARGTMKRLGRVLDKAPRTHGRSVDISSYDSVMKAGTTEFKNEDFHDSLFRMELKTKLFATTELLGRKKKQHRF